MNYKKALAILDLKNGYTKKELKKAYFYKILMYHPDKNKEHSDGVMFNKVKESYEYLNQENHTSGISNDDCKCQDGSRENEINQNMGNLNLKYSMKQILLNYFSDLILKFYHILLMSDNAVSRKILQDMDRRLEGRKPIESIRDDISELKVEMIHIKNYIRKLEIREQIKEEKNEPVDKYEILDNNRPEKENQRGWFW